MWKKFSICGLERLSVSGHYVPISSAGEDKAVELDPK